MAPTKLQHLLHKKAWTLSNLFIELQKNETPLSYPILIMIKKGYRKKIIRDKDGKIIRHEKVKYNPNRHTLMDIAKIFKVKPEQVYEDRSKE